ncbi:universal stress protein [Leifsonia sp. NPDC058248]|uniref:universal stress protein n=1 Tax=Leifsonia sp. NPDC058248 TaxID=3346402 RepID=UPI0036D83C4A
MDARTKEIVVGVDGSRRSIDALRRGYRIADALHCRLVALTAWHYPITFGAYVVNGWEPENDARAAQLSAIDEVFGQEPPAWFSAEFVEGTAAQALIQRSHNAEMVIVGSRGRGGFPGLLLGSVSTQVAAHAQCPVLVVHDREPA